MLCCTVYAIELLPLQVGCSVCGTETVMYKPGVCFKLALAVSMREFDEVDADLRPSSTGRRSDGPLWTTINQNLAKWQCAIIPYW